MSDELQEIIEQFLKLVSGRLDEYTTQKGKVVVSKNTVTLFTPSHIQFAKYGRGPGKLPPIEPLVDWVKKKGIVKNDKEARGTAWAIAKSISKKGTKNYVPNAPNALTEAIEEEFDNYVEKISGFITDEINEQILDLIVEAIPIEYEVKVK